MQFEQFKSIINQYPFKLLFNSNRTAEYQYVYPDVCNYLIVRFSINPNFIEVPYEFRYSEKEKHIVPIDKNNTIASSYYFYKQIVNPSEQDVHNELSRIIKELKQTQFNLKIEKIKMDF